MTSGGHRPGSGRKKSEYKKQFLGVKISPELLIKLKENPAPASQVVEAALRRYFGE